MKMLSGAKWRYVLVLGAVAIIVIAGVLTYVYTERKEKEKTAGLILFLKGEKHNIYVDSETLQMINSSDPGGSPLLEVLMKPLYNATFADAVARKFLNEPVRGSGSVFEYHEKNDTMKRVLVDQAYTITYINDEYTSAIIPKEQVLSNETLINLSYSIIQRFRGDYSDLRVEIIQTPKLIIVNGSSGKEELIGYGGQLVVFRQYINGVPVMGFHGTVKISFGPGGVLQSYMDFTVPCENVSQRGGTVRSVRSVFQDIADGGTTLEGRDLRVVSWTLCFMTTYPPQIERRNGESHGVAVMKYMVKLAPLRGSGVYVEYFSAY